MLFRSRLVVGSLFWFLESTLLDSNTAKSSLLVARNLRPDPYRAGWLLSFVELLAKLVSRPGFSGWLFSGFAFDVESDWLLILSHSSSTTGRVLVGKT